MECTRVSELLPWFANGSLEAEEAESVRRHLDGCEECRRELGDTLAAFELFDQHLPAESLLEIAFDGSSRTVSRELAERHLDGCAICSEELALVRESRAALEAAAAEAAPAEPPERGQPARVERFPAAVADAGPWRRLALAASVGAMVATGGWIWSWQQRAMDVETRSVFRGDGPLQDVGTEDVGPLLNVPVIEAFPLRLSADAGDGRLVANVPAGARGVTLILSSSLGGEEKLACRLVAPGGGDVWTRRGLERRPEGGFTLAFSTEALAPGRYTLVLQSATGEQLEAYPLDVG